MADKPTAETNTPQKRKVQRSPNYPTIGLEAAVRRARTLYAQENRHETQVNTALRHWGYTNPSSSTAQGTLSALLKYGLLISSGTGDSRKVRISDSALKIILDERDHSTERDRLLREAALAPALHNELWQKWGAELPSDQNVRTYLVIDREFNAKVVDELIKQYKATLAFAKIDKRDKATDNDDDAKPTVGSYVQWSSQGVDQFAEPRQVRDISDDGEWALLEGSDTGVAMSELKVVEPPEKTVERQPYKPATQNPFAAKAKDEVTEKPGFALERRVLDEGAAVLQWPDNLSEDSVEDLEFRCRLHCLRRY